MPPHILPINPFNIENRVNWDGELIVDLALAGASIHQTQMVLGDFRIYPNSITGSGRLAEMAKLERDRIARKVFGRDPTKWEKIVAYIIRNYLAINRQIFPKVTFLRETD